MIPHTTTFGNYQDLLSFLENYKLKNIQMIYILEMLIIYKMIKTFPHFISFYLILKKNFKNEKTPHLLISSFSHFILHTGPKKYEIYEKIFFVFI
jgi:hypothetical protein